MNPPKEPTKPGLGVEPDPALAASAANAVEQWRIYQNAYSLYQQQQHAYEEYVQKQATLTSYEEQQAAYNQYLEAHNQYQSQLEQYEQHKAYQEYYASTGNGAPVADYYNTGPYPPPTMMAAPVFTTPLANVDPFYNKGSEHYRDPSTLKHRSEAFIKRTKVYTTTNFYANPEDEGLFPVELKALFKNLECGLCKCKMNSHISANVHYQSKVHERKIIQWLKDWCERTGTPMPYRAKRKAVPVEPVGPNSLRCEACDLPLTSIQHANQHYTGKRHRMVVLGKKTPAGKGVFIDGKWSRQVSGTDENPERFGIGQAFAKQKVRYSAKDAKRPCLEPPPSPPQGVKDYVGNFLENPAPAVVPDASLYPAPDSTPYGPVYPYAPNQSTESQSAKTVEAEILKKQSSDCVDESGVFCKVCQIAVTSVAVMETHLKGVKHIKKLKSVGRMPPPRSADGKIESILSTLNKPPQQNDWSLYRMPSGKYYCKTCNAIMADEKLFSHHWYGKKHKLKVKQEMEELTGSTDKKTKFYRRNFVKAKGD